MSPEEIRISTVIPTYNRAEFVLRAIDSALRQSSPPDEIIVVDDGSTDATQELVTAIDPPVTYLRQEHKGASAARNTGVRASTSPWIAFLDSDDFWLPKKLARERRWLSDHARPQTACVYSLFLYHGPDYRVMGPRRELRGSVSVRDLLRYGSFGMSSTVVRKRALQAVGGFDERLKAVVDWDLWLRLALKGFSFDHLPEVGVVCNQSPDGLTVDLRMKERQMFLVLDSFFRRSDLPERVSVLEHSARAWAYLRLGAAHMGRLQMDHARRCLFQAWCQQQGALWDRDAAQLLLGATLGAKAYSALRGLKRSALSERRGLSGNAAPDR